jgi:glycosyltransferase involved in cell wall biosynthesis
MRTPRVSVIVPTYRGGDLLGEAIRSVLEQSYDSLELIVVDDASGEARGVVARFDDPRLRFIEHETNRGSDAARMTALDVSSGDIVAFLDQDDLFHPEKLAVHVAFLEAHPEVGFTYNPHLLLLHPSGEIGGLWRPPEQVRLEDFICGFPLAPSTWVVRREWATRADAWDERTMFRGRETVFCGRLFVAGCRFAMVDRALNYRRIQVGRRYADPVGKCRDERRCQAIMLDDPRCPPETRAVRDVAAAENCLVWANVALAQGDTEVGRSLLREALALAPRLTAHNLYPVIEFVLSHAVVEAEDAEAQLRAVIEGFPPEIPGATRHLEWAVGQAHLIKGARHVIWGRPADADPHWRRVVELGARPDEMFLRRLSHELLEYEHEVGTARARSAVRALGRAMLPVGGRALARRITGRFFLGRAFRDFAEGRTTRVPATIARAVVGDPMTAADRGAWSLLLQSVTGRRRAPRPAEPWSPATS